MNILTEVNLIVNYMEEFKKFKNLGEKEYFYYKCASRRLHPFLVEGLLATRNYKINENIPVIEDPSLFENLNIFNFFVESISNLDVNEIILTEKVGSYIFKVSNIFKYFGYEMSSTIISSKDHKNINAVCFYKN